MSDSQNKTVKKSKDLISNSWLMFIAKFFRIHVILQFYFKPVGKIDGKIYSVDKCKSGYSTVVSCLFGSAAQQHIENSLLD